MAILEIVLSLDVREIVKESDLNHLPKSSIKPTVNPGDLIKENDSPVSTLISKVRHFDTIGNNSIVIQGKLKTDDADDSNDFEHIGDDGQEDWKPMLNVNPNVTIFVKTPKSLTQDEKPTEKYKVPIDKDLKETYKVTSNENLSSRPKFHVMKIPMDLISDKPKPADDNKLLKKEARIDLENREIEFPNFATQFFGSLDDGSIQKFDVSKAPLHYSDQHHDHFSGDTLSHRPHIDHHIDQSYHHSLGPQPGPEYSAHDNSHYTNIPQPVTHPKREILSSYSHKPSHNKPTEGKYSITKDSLYVQDPWSHIDKV